MAVGVPRPLLEESGTSSRSSFLDSSGCPPNGGCGPVGTVGVVVTWRPLSLQGELNVPGRQNLVEQRGDRGQFPAATRVVADGLDSARLRPAAVQPTLTVAIRASAGDDHAIPATPAAAAPGKTGSIPA